MEELANNDEVLDILSERMDGVMMDREDPDELIADIEEAQNDFKIEMLGLTPSETAEAAKFRSYQYMLKEMLSTLEDMKV